MESDITYFVTKPCPCLKQRRPNLSTHAPLTSVTTSPPFELVSIDFLHDLDQSSGGYEYIRLYIDLFTRFAQAYPPNKSNTTAADRP